MAPYDFRQIFAAYAKLLFKGFKTVIELSAFIDCLNYEKEGKEKEKKRRSQRKRKKRICYYILYYTILRKKETIL